jgi:hypothetical protein
MFRTLVKVLPPGTPGRKLWSKFCCRTLQDENFGQSFVAGHSGTKTSVKVRTLEFLTGREKSEIGQNSHHITNIFKLKSYEKNYHRYF